MIVIDRLRSTIFFRSIEKMIDIIFDHFWSIDKMIDDQTSIVQNIDRFFSRSFLIDRNNDRRSLIDRSKKWSNFFDHDHDPILNDRKNIFILFRNFSLLSLNHVWSFLWHFDNFQNQNYFKKLNLGTTFPFCVNKACFFAQKTFLFVAGSMTGCLV